MGRFLEHQTWAASTSLFQVTLTALWHLLHAVLGVSRWVSIFVRTTPRYVEIHEKVVFIVAPCLLATEYRTGRLQTDDMNVTGFPTGST